MQWSQLKKRAEELLAPSLRGRVAYHSTHYRHAHDSEGRCWITVDGREIVDMSTLRAWADQHRRAARSQGLPEDATWHHSAAVQGNEAYWRDWRHAEEERKRAGIFAQWDFENALGDYLQLSVEAALTHDCPLVRSLALLDRRLGKRRLMRLTTVELQHPLVRAIYDLRCESEGWANSGRADA